MTPQSPPRRPPTEAERIAAKALRAWINATGRYGGGLMDGDGIVGVEIKGCVSLVDIAAIVIRAIRVPTKEMLDAADNEELRLGYCIGAFETIAPEEAWPVMIDVASPPEKT